MAFARSKVVMMVPELLLLAAGVLLARVGLALQVSGLSRAKNAGGGVQPR